MSKQRYEGKTAAEAAIRACEDLGLTRGELRQTVVSDEGELLSRRVVIEVEVPAQRSGSSAAAEAAPAASTGRSFGAERGEAEADLGQEGRRGARRGRPRRGDERAAGRSERPSAVPSVVPSEIAAGQQALGTALPVAPPVGPDVPPEQGAASGQEGAGGGRRRSRGGRRRGSGSEAREGATEADSAVQADGPGRRAERRPGRRAEGRGGREMGAEATAGSNEAVDRSQGYEAAAAAPGRRRPERNDGRSGQRDGREGGIDSLLAQQAVSDMAQVVLPRLPAIAPASARSARVCQVVAELVALMGFDLEERLVSENEVEMHVHLHGPSEAQAVGDKGEVLLSLQFAVNRILSRYEDEGEQVLVLDAGGYRQRRQMAIEKLARDLAQRALAHAKAVRLSPMSAHDRRIFHMALKDMEGIVTQSEGDGVFRNLLIVPSQFL